MSIHQNLRDLRAARGMTQDQVAAQLNVTRQAVSSYESGRTRPDIDTLLRLAEIYQVSLDQILYGQDQALAHPRRLRTLAWAVAAALVLLCLLTSALRCANNILFPMKAGFLDGNQELVQLHLRLSAVWEGLDGLTLVLSLVGFLVLLCLELTWNVKISLRQRGIYTGSLCAGLLLASLPFAGLDPVFAAADYGLTALFILCRLLLFQAIALAFFALRRRRDTR